MPTYASGLSGQVGAVAEVTYGTPVTVTRFYEFLSENFQFVPVWLDGQGLKSGQDRKSTRLNSSHQIISYAAFCLKKKKQTGTQRVSRTMEPTGTATGLRSLQLPTADHQ